MDAKGAGGTTCSSSGCGAASSTRWYSCGPTKASARHATRSAVISMSITLAVLIRALTALHRTSLLQPAANPLGGLTPADPPLIDAEILFKQPGQFKAGLHRNRWAKASRMRMQKKPSFGGDQNCCTDSTGRIGVVWSGAAAGVTADVTTAHRNTTLFAITGASRAASTD